jgi:serine O-acetyltransferase
MLFEAIAKCCGGIWALREFSLVSNSTIVRRLSNIVYSQALNSKGSWISADARFETIPIFPHGLFGIFISGGVQVGKNCVIFQHVTIGSNTLIDSSSIGAPVIGDNCYIGAGAKIIGKVTIGRNVRVGANATVVRDVPENSIVIASEQRVVNRDQPLNNHFYHKYKGKWRYFDNGKPVLVADEQELRLLESRFSMQNRSYKG